MYGDVPPDTVTDAVPLVTVPEKLAPLANPFTLLADTLSVVDPAGMTPALATIPDVSELGKRGDSAVASSLNSKFLALTQ